MNTKKTYFQPFIRVEVIYLEHAIAAGSALLLPGSSNAELTPEVEDWNNDWDTDRDFDL